MIPLLAPKFGERAVPGHAPPVAADIYIRPFPRLWSSRRWRAACCVWRRSLWSRDERDEGRRSSHHRDEGRRERERERERDGRDKEHSRRKDKGKDKERSSSRRHREHRSGSGSERVDAKLREARAFLAAERRERERRERAAPVARVDLGPPCGVPPREAAKADAYFQLNYELSVWLAVTRGVYFTDLGSDEARRIFADEFLPEYNTGRLPAALYGGVSDAMGRAARTEAAWRRWAEAHAAGGGASGGTASAGPSTGGRAVRWGSSSCGRPLCWRASTSGACSCRRTRAKG